jgi:zinc protease
MKLRLAVALLALAGIPATSHAARVELGRTAREKLPNGLQVVILERHEVPLAHLLFVAKGGSSTDPAGKAGALSLAVESLRRGAGGRSAIQIEEALDGLGARLATATNPDDARIGLDLLVKDLSRGLDLLADLVLRTRFEPAEVEKEKAQTLARLEQLKDEPSAVASRHFQALLYGAHPYGRPEEGTSSSVGALGRDDVAAAHAARFVPANCVLVVVGDLSAASVLEQVRERFGSWKGDASESLEIAPPEAPRGRRVLLLDKPDSSQSQVRLGGLGIRRADPAYEALLLANTVLGGGFTSRLVDRLRVDLSLTYGASSQMPARRTTGPLFVSTFTPTETSRKILDAALEVLAKFREQGPTAQELEKARGYLSGLFAIGLQSLENVAHQLASEQVFGLPADSLATTLDRYAAVTLEQAREAAKRYRTDDLTIVLLGKAEAVKPQLEGLGEVRVEPFTKEP